MFGHEAVGVAEPIQIGYGPAEDIQKHVSIGIIKVYRALDVPSGHRMVDGAGILES